MPSLRRLVPAVLAAAAALMLAACAAPPPREGLSLAIAHLNDHHAHLAPHAGVVLRLDGTPTRVELGGMARLATLFRAEAQATPNLLRLHAGDALTGTLYHTLYRGEADARLLQTLCLDAFALGNHEFDDGDAVLRGFLDRLREGGGCAGGPPVPALAANVEPAPGTPLAPDAGGPVLRPHVVKVIDGVPVGIVGIVVSGKTANASRPLPSTRFLDEVTTAQRSIDALRAQGVRHIVLLTHQGLAADRAMAAALTGVDVIIGGDSHTLMGDFDAVGLRAAAPYPVQARNRDGEPVCIGHAWEYAKVYARMDVRFDAQGRVARCGGQASLVIGDDLRRDGADGRPAPVDAATREALRAWVAATPAVRMVAPDPEATRRLSGYAARIDAEKARPVGTAAQALCLVRVPGETTPRSGGVPGCEEAGRLARGSDVAQVVAEAFLAASRRADVALQNAGGVRTPVPAGPVTMGTAFGVLPFTNLLVEMELTGAELLAVLEDGVANHLDARQSDGSHPYAAGLRWDLDLRQPRGSRFSGVEVRDRADGAWRALEPTRRYRLVTNDFIAAGKDGYATLGRLAAEGRAEPTYLLYTQTFADHLAAAGTVRRPDASQVSHRRVILADGTVLR